MTDLQNLLRQTAEVYTNLVQHAKAASVPIPPEAQLGGGGVKRGPEELQYDEFAAAGAADWDDFQDEGMRLQMFVVCQTFRAKHREGFTLYQERWHGDVV